MKHQPVKQGQTITGADPGFFLGESALVSCSTSTLINHIVFFFGRIPVVLENRRSSQGEEGVRTPCTLPLDPPLHYTGNSGNSVPTLYDECVGFLTSPADHITLKMQYTGPTIYRPYPRRLGHLSTCGCHCKGSMLRP